MSIFAFNLPLLHAYHICFLLDFPVIVSIESLYHCLAPTLTLQKGNIAKFLLQEGFARLADWSMGVVSTGAEQLREAEK